MNTPQKNFQTKLTKGLLDIIILEILDNHPMHGYQLITTIRKSFGVYFGSSTIYPLLTLMEKENYIKCEWTINGERPRKVYTLTNNGKSMLNYTTGSLRAICKTIETTNSDPHTEIKNMQLYVAQSPINKELSNISP